MGGFRPRRGAPITSSPAASLIGIFGGSFDPPHCGHLALVRAGLDRLGFDEVWVMPASPVHRGLSGHADAGQRLRWLQAMFAGDRRVRVLDCELRKGRPVATIETLREFSGVGVPWLMLGADAWAGLPDWRDYPAHMQFCNIAVFARQGVAMTDVPGWKPVSPDALRACAAPGHVVRLDVELPDVSATAIREACSRGLPLAGMIPETIRAEVERLYGRHGAEKRTERGECG